MMDARALEALLSLLDRKDHVIDQGLVREVLGIASQHQFDADRSVAREGILAAVTAFVENTRSTDGA